MASELKPIKTSEFFKMLDDSSIQEAFEHIKSEGLSLKPSTKYSVLVNDEPFPPKDFLRIIAELKGYKIIEDSFYGGKANKPFENLGYQITNNVENVNYKESLVLPQITKYQNAINNTDWLRTHESYKFNFIKWIEEHIDFENDSNEEIKSKIEDSQLNTYSPNSNTKGVNFIQTITRYQDDYLTINDVEKLKDIIYNNSTINKENLTLSFGSFPKTSAFLCLFAPERFMAYDGESIPAYEYLSKGLGIDAPKRNFKAFQFYQIFYHDIKKQLKQSDLDTTVFKDILNIDALTELHWNFITQDFLLFIARKIMPNSLQKKYDDFIENQVPETWEWYQSIKKYTEAITVLKKNCFRDKYTNYNDLNQDYKVIINNNDEDFLQRYLFEADNGFSTIRQQLIKISQREKIVEKVNNDFGLIKNILLETDTQKTFELIHSFIETNKWSVIYRFLRALFPGNFTSVDAPKHFETLINKLNVEFDITLNGKNQIEKNNEILNLIQFDDIYKAQIFFWMFKDDDATSISFIEHFGNWLDKKTSETQVDLLVQVKLLIKHVIEDNKIEETLLNGLDIGTLKAVLKEFNETNIVIDKNSHYFKYFLNELIMENDNLFELYHEYLVENRSKDIQQATINNYVDEASNVIPSRWKELYGTSFDEFIINHRNLLELEPILRKGFSGQMSFMWFINNLLEKYELKFPLNQILYGPPGTGKTYKTKELAVKIIDGYASTDRPELLKRYEELIESQQIHFTTFHQSMSYEDFIEGIKPKMNDNGIGEIEYEIRPGIFKQICELANNNKIINFDEAYESLIKDIAESDTEYLVLKTPREKEYRLNVNSNDNLSLFTSSEIKKQGVLSREKLQKQFQGEVAFKGWEGYAKGVLDYLEENYGLYKQEESIKKKQVLIIDEINRGNVSAIFGELITLIEEDKRAGKKETIYATLPYSQKKFSVPNNVFIVGTMNTADRSVEALDTALRRRFSFEEILPKPELLKDHDYQDVNLENLLSTINQRIELLVDKDHQIGHSYFFGINSLEDLRIVFMDKIIPLLEEYFYGDFGKIGLVLGENFIEPKKVENKTILAKFKAYEDIDFVTDKKIFRLKKGINEMTVDDFKSIYENQNNK